MQRGLELQEGPMVPSPLAARPEDVVQGAIAACPIAAVMTAMAGARPANLGRILGPPQNDDVFSKRRDDEIFRYWTRFYYDVTFPGRGSPTRISPMVYVQDGAVQYASSPGGAGWPSYIEKAYAVWKSGGGQGGSGGDYTRLDLQISLTAPPNLGQVMRDLIGPFDVLDQDGNQFIDAQRNARPLRPGDVAAVAARAGRRPTVAPTIAAGADRFGLVSSHAYAVLGFRAGVRVRNPWGGPGATSTISVAIFRQAFRGMWQAV
jgi:hypothetical protein